MRRRRYAFLEPGVTLPALCEQRGGVIGKRMIKSGGGGWWCNATIMTNRERASQRRAFYGIHPGDELTRAKPSLAPVHWLHARPSMFWDLPEREFARALAGRKLAGPT
jgi:hypothetical protein